MARTFDSIKGSLQFRSEVQFTVVRMSHSKRRCEKNSLFPFDKTFFLLISGSLEECRLAQSSIEKNLCENSQQWLSTETELSDDDEEDNDDV